MGVDMMELDVKMTRDSVLVLCHDKTINRPELLIKYLDSIGRHTL